MEKITIHQFARHQRLYPAAAIVVATLAAAPAGAQSTLYGSVGFGTPTDLYTIDTTTGGATSVGPLNINFLDGLAYDTDDDIMYGVTNGGLHTVDLTTGNVTTVGAFGGGPAVESVAYDSSTGTLYGVGTGGADFLATIDQTTGALTGVGSIGGSTSIFGLTYDPNADLLYGLDPFADQLVTINRTTGAASAVGGTLGLPAPFFQAIAFDAETNKLYGANQTDDQLYEINTTTGAASAVGPFGLGDITGMAFVPPTPPRPPPTPTIGILFATGTSAPNNKLLFTINQDTGATIARGQLGNAANDYRGMAYDTSRNQLLGLASDFNAGAWDPASLLLIDPVNGTATEIAQLTDNVTSNTFEQNLTSLTYDDDNDVLYAIQSVTGVNSLLSINPTTGVTTVLGAITLNVPGEGTVAGDIDGMAYDTDTNTLYLATTGAAGTAAGPYLYELNLGTLIATGVLSLPTDTTGLAYDTIDGVLYANNASQLFEVDLTGGTLTPVGGPFLSTLRNLTFASIPEPTTLGLLLVAGFIASIRHRPATRG